MTKRACHELRVATNNELLSKGDHTAVWMAFVWTTVTMAVRLMGICTGFFIHGERYKFPIRVGHGHGVGDHVVAQQAVDPVH